MMSSGDHSREVTSIRVSDERPEKALKKSSASLPVEPAVGAELERGAAVVRTRQTTR
jgi:hypothetical protein